MVKIPHLRWLIAFTLFLAAVLNYLDRSVLGLLAPTIQKDLAISDNQYASVINFFLIAYTVAYLFSGRIVDKLGVRLSFALFIGWWSISNALTGFAQGVRSLSVFRFMLGLGEAGSWTASPKAVAEWFPASERGVAVGIYSVGGSVGATVAPLLVIGIASHFGWRWVFLVTLSLAWLWIGLWLLLYRSPMRHPWITPKERAYLAENIPPPEPKTEESEGAAWGHVLRQPLVWLFMLARLLTDSVWYFYQFWLAKYLHTAHGVPQSQLSILWTVFLAADLGFLGGGFFAGRLIKRGQLAPAARLWLMLGSACITPISFVIPFVAGLAGVIALTMLVAFALTCWLGNLTSLIVDLVPKSILGTSFGVIATGSALGGICMNQIVAWLILHRSYADCFYLMALVHPIAICFLWPLRKRACAA